MASCYKSFILWFSELNGCIYITCKRVGDYNILLLVDVKIWINEHTITLSMIFVYTPNRDTCKSQFEYGHDLGLFILVNHTLICHDTTNNIIQTNTTLTDCCL